MSGIPGGSDFVETVLMQQDEDLQRWYGHRAAGYDFDKVIDKATPI